MLDIRRPTAAIVLVIVALACGCASSKPELPESVKQALAKVRQEQQEHVKDQQASVYQRTEIASSQNSAATTNATTVATKDITTDVKTGNATEVPVDGGPDDSGMTEAEKAARDHRINQSLIDTSEIKLSTGKLLSIPKEGASESPRNDNIHDPHNAAISMLQDPTLALATFPRDRRQQVNWVQALDQGLISPRADLKGESKMMTMDLDILMKNTQFMPWVKFPHLQHTKWLACQNCHPAIFVPQQDANPITMNKVLRGEYCGVCHDKVAFALFTCERCHSVPHEGSGPKWW